MPEGDVVVHRQVLAQPGPGLTAASWARLADGTPLITGVQRGEGWLILVHTTANTTWSSLPLSGVFVDLMQRFARSGTVPAARCRACWRRSRCWMRRAVWARRARRCSRCRPRLSPRRWSAREHPPGLYGRIEAGEDAARQALNLASAVPELTALEPADFAVPPQDFAGSAEVDLMPWILLAALLLALADTVIGLILRGLVPGRLRPAPVAGRVAAAARPAGRVACAGPGRGDHRRDLRDPVSPMS